MTLMQLYFFTVILPNLYKMCDFLSGALIVVAIIFCVIAFLVIEQDNTARVLFRTAIKLCISAIILFLIEIPLPNDKQLYTLAGAYVVTNTKDINKLPNNVVKAANAWLENAAKSAEYAEHEKQSKE